MKNRIILAEDLLIGKGAHKKTYIDPTDAGRCIKIPHVTPDVDLDRELRYRDTRKNRNRKSRLLPDYYGTVETNMGTGYVFERIVDFDGKTCLSIQDLFDRADKDSSLLPFVRGVMGRFRSMLFEELVVTSNVEPVNFVVQRLSANDFTVRIIDNIGSPVFLPLAYYSDFFARKRLKRYWARFLDELQEEHPAVMTDMLKQRLL